jgi:hypothetical protein
MRSKWQTLRCLGASSARAARSVARRERQQGRESSAPPCCIRVEQATERDRQKRTLAPASSFEEALSLVITNGFLYRYDCLSIASTSTGCNDVWKENKQDFPEWANVEIHFEDTVGRNSPDRSMSLCNVSQELLTSHAFLRQVFDKASTLNVEETSTSGKKRAQAEPALLKWGVDIQVAKVLIFRDSPGTCRISVSFGKAESFSKDTKSFHKCPWRCFLWPDLTLSSGYVPGRFGCRRWGVYDGESVWP